MEREMVSETWEFGVVFEEGANWSFAGYHAYAGPVNRMCSSL